MELCAAVNELQFLVNGKVSQIYQRGRELLLQLHARGRGKSLIKIVPGKFVSVTQDKDVSARPAGFCMLLRKYVGNSIIRGVRQQGSERILIIDLEKEQKYSLVVELFSTGNVVLLDSEGMTIGSLEQQEWKDRSVKNREIYVFPEPKVDWRELGEKGFSEIISGSDRKNIAVCLATQVGLAGTYAEEILRCSDIDKETLPGEIGKVQMKGLYREFCGLREKLEKPKGYVYENEIAPFALKNMEIVREIESYCEALDILNPFEKTSPYEKNISALQKTISHQEMAIVSQEKKIELYTLKGELIYEKYNVLQKLLDIVGEMGESKEWSEIGKELKKQKKIMSVDMRGRKVVIEL